MARVMRIAALIVAAGNGERAGGTVPKQYARLAGKAVIAHSIDTFQRHPAITGCFVVIGAGQETVFASALGKRVVDGVVTGGAHRSDSVRSGLDAIHTSGGFDAVLVHDAARPGLTDSVIGSLVSALAESVAAVPVLPVADTLAHGSEVLGAVVDRAGLVRVQTPQAFHLQTVRTAHAEWNGAPATDDSQIVRAAGHVITLVPGDARLEKITAPEDYARVEQMLSPPMISRTGFGYDVHRLVPGLPLVLCGVPIAHDHGLSGHSDADVALHALVDALLGAISAGDIGAHFPPSDPQWKGASSDRFVHSARDMIGQQGGIIDHVDLTLVCEAPRIGPHRDAMRHAIAAMLDIPVSHVSVKATTTERLGFAGRGEGIAAQAVATVRMPRDA